MLSMFKEASVKFTIRPKGSNLSAGGLAVSAEDAREALDVVKAMTDRGMTEVQIFDADGQPYDLIELERVTSEAEKNS